MNQYHFIVQHRTWLKKVCLYERFTVPDPITVRITISKMEKFYHGQLDICDSPFIVNIQRKLLVHIDKLNDF